MMDKKTKDVIKDITHDAFVLGVKFGAGKIGGEKLEKAKQKLEMMVDIL